MGFRNEFFSQARVPERIRRNSRAVLPNHHRDPHARSAEFPYFARELALHC